MQGEAQNYASLSGADRRRNKRGIIYSDARTKTILQIRRKNKMTQLELHHLLGEEIKKVYDSEKMPRETQIKVLDGAQISLTSKEPFDGYLVF